jgi:hypothetical protein
MPKKRDNPLVLESEQAFEDGAIFTANQVGGLVIAVADTQAVGSYNEQFECKAHLTKEQAAQLRDGLNRWFPA